MVLKLVTKKKNILIIIICTTNSIQDINHDRIKLFVWLNLIVSLTECVNRWKTSEIKSSFVLRLNLWEARNSQLCLVNSSSLIKLDLSYKASRFSLIHKHVLIKLQKIPPLFFFNEVDYDPSADHTLFFLGQIEIW